jgi:hypothetical protein
MINEFFCLITNFISTFSYEVYLSGYNMGHEHGRGGNDSRYQTGALTPLLRWFSQSAQRAMMPPQQPNPVLPEGNLEEGESLVTIHEI